ncbi:ComEC/Rec2 family competence protein [Campylobacterota bacterium DY0563]
MDSLQLLSDKKDFFALFLLILFVLSTNLIFEYFKYSKIKQEEIYEDSFRIINIYDKKDYYVLKLKNDDLTFFTSINKKLKLEKLDYINIAFITLQIDFLNFLKGFYAKSIYFEKEKKDDDLKKILYEKIVSQHKQIELKQLFSALFLAVPISKEYRDIYTGLSISHLIAISGFHLSILTAIIYALIFYPYKIIQEKYFLYRNRKMDIMFITIIVLFFYLLLTDMVPSLLRSFVMFVFAIIFLRSNIKLLSYKTLLITCLFIISLYPQYIFSISLWFSLSGVFYIFLYLQYFKSLPILINIVFFNFWIYFAFNPIIHFFFFDTSYEQLLSPIFTLIFSIFYPFELFLHLINYGDLLDNYLIYLLNFSLDIKQYETSLYFFAVYILFSLLSIFGKKYFIILNILLMIFSINMFI